MKAVRAVVLGMLLAAAATPIAAATPAPLELERTLPLPGVSGRIDHLAVDLQRRRLFVAELGNGSIEMIDLAQGRPVYRLTGLKEPQGLAWLPQSDQLVVATGGDGMVRFFAGPDLRPAGQVALGDDADNVRVDEATGEVVVGYGAGGLAVIDPVGKRLVRTIPLGAHPEGFRIDPAGRRAFVNLPNSRRITVADLTTGKVVSTWPQGLSLANFPMALEAEAGVLAVVFRAPAQLALVDMHTGAVRQRLPACGDSDDVFFDAKRRNIYVSCGEGAVEAFHADGPAYARVGRIATRSGARTSLFVPELDRLFVAARAQAGAPAALLVLRPRP